MDVDISIIIVNYNVQYFIEQCLNSIFTLSHFAGSKEVIVVDNDSQDGSVEMLKQKFPNVKLIANKANVGFSVANNQGFRIARGKYILMLNPDTLLEENTLQKCFDKMESEMSIATLGVKMLDGSGRFLPESKRGFPSPAASFYKFTGIHKLFPKSPTINKYYFGHVDEDETAEVEILCGAFMFMRKSDLLEIGMLDEAFFMYGEDIDLSYRFTQARKKVVYFPESTIIHFKGESTKKHSRKYVNSFYNAMKIFANKHFVGSRARTFTNSLSLVISLKAGIQYLRNILNFALLPILDTVLIFSGLILISKLWANFYFDESSYYDSAPLLLNFIGYTVIWIVAVLYGGGYDAKYKISKLARNIVIGTVVILAVYGLLPSEYRSSRAIIVLSTFLVMFSTIFVRVMLRYFETGRIFDSTSKGKSIILISSANESKRIKEVLAKSSKNFSDILVLPLTVSKFELREILDIRKVDEVICNVKELSMNRVIDLMASLGSLVSFKITGDETLGIIGSKSKNTSGEIYTVSVNYAIQDPSKRRVKRTIDIFGSIIFLILSPLLLLKGKKLNLFSTLVGKSSLVGYNMTDDEVGILPKLKPSLIFVGSQSKDLDEIHSANLNYAKKYSAREDINRLLNYIRN